jgi:hypothetical protein
MKRMVEAILAKLRGEQPRAKEPVVRVVYEADEPYPRWWD